MLKIDAKNALNLINRNVFIREVQTHLPFLAPWVVKIYIQDLFLFAGEKVLLSKTGVQQGDPLAMLLFAIAIHSIIKKIQELANIKLNVWYADDGTIIGDITSVASAVRIMEEEGPKIGFHLCKEKCEIWWLSHDLDR